jgi:glycosyltransferase involved in cell wall biosynthesis
VCPHITARPQLQRAIESILAQDYSELELLISDNASTDDTQRICENFSARDHRVRYFRQPYNRGPHDNFVEVWKKATGEFFMWLGDDDWLDRSYIGRCVQVFGEHADYSLVCGKAKYFREGKSVYEGVPVSLLEEQANDRVLAYYRQVCDNGTFHGLMRRNQVSAVPIRNVVGGDGCMLRTLLLLKDQNVGGC